MELLLWLEQLYLWRLQRDHAAPKQEYPRQTEDEELPQASYPGANNHADHNRYCSLSRRAHSRIA